MKITIEAARRKLRQEIAYAEKEQERHAKTLGKCNSDCQQVQREYWMRLALVIIGGRA